MNLDNRTRANQLFHVGVKAADPTAAVLDSLKNDPLPQFRGRLFVLAFGKAAHGMASAALAHLGDAETLVITTPENATPLAGATVIAGAHPVPDETSVLAGQAVLKHLAKMGADDLVLALISGGGSALMVAPALGLTLADKIAVNQLLLGSGLDITAMNMIRQNLSRLKGGGVLQAATPARVVSLVLSDVVDDDLRVVASGPTSTPIGTAADALAAIQTAGLTDKMPEAALRSLADSAQTRPNIPPAVNRLIGSNAKSVAAMAKEEPAAHSAPQALVGDVGEAAQTIVRCKSQGIWIFGGETTVQLAGTGLGGRNQELALRVALLAEAKGWHAGWVFLSGGTDGRDGPTDAAGGIVDAGSLDRMRAAGVNPEQALRNNDSYHALKAADDLLLTGATGTNVADLQVLIRP